jgi:calcium permeable stress-gated cation channel
MEEGKDECDGERFAHPGSANIFFIVCVSLALGVVSFFAFCFWRPRWKTLYAARKRRIEGPSKLPQLPDTFFGWIPVLYRIDESDVLHSAGLDAYVVSLVASVWIWSASLLTEARLI